MKLGLAPIDVYIILLINPYRRIGRPIKGKQKVVPERNKELGILRLKCFKVSSKKEFLVYSAFLLFLSLHLTGILI
jgi:hypothetical protein